ncbi:hypothetical protein [Pseudonocardia lacus]|uniref:hypothetical protein n=1 Tax=Pseudonocardia lacus TaxID=2835865 RepID=UPI001BDD9E3F|nr:hypothetical protein [Pseudonocardia lacus]
MTTQDRVLLLLLRVLLVVGVLGSSSATAPGAVSEHPFVATGAGSSAGSPVLEPLEVVVLADESKSLDDTAVAVVQDAARTIIASVLPPRSVVSVVGFGSQNEPGQTAAQAYCTRIELINQVGREELSDCVRKIHRRAPAEGADTDHLIALGTARDLLGVLPDAPKLVFVLTDGRLDVPDSPIYGSLSTPDQRTEVARAGMTETLRSLDELGVQVWPLGFGEVSDDDLAELATGRGCSSTGDPVARVVGADLPRLVEVVRDAFEAATCVRFNDAVAGTVDGVGPVEIPVEVPDIATDVAVVVRKGPADLVVSYLGPNGDSVDLTGDDNGLRYNLSGQSDPTEVLHIDRPRGGRWTVVIRSPTGAGAHDVVVNVAYQAAFNSRLTVEQQQLAAGDSVDVSMSVLVGDQILTDTSDLEHLSLAVELAGEQPAVRSAVALAVDASGIYRGRLEVPAEAVGELVVTGSVSGIGVAPNEIERTVSVLPEPAVLRGAIVVAPVPVAPGEALSGSVDTVNLSDLDKQLRVRLKDATGGLKVELEENWVEPDDDTVQFEVQVPSDSPEGWYAVQVRVLDGDDRALVEKQLNILVEEPPGTLEKWAPWLAVLVLLLVLAFCVYALRTRLPLRLQGLSVIVQNRSGKSTLAPRRKWSRIFCFYVVYDPDDDDALRRATALFIVKRALMPFRSVAEGRFWVVWRSRDGLSVRPRAGGDEESTRSPATNAVYRSPRPEIHVTLRHEPRDESDRISLPDDGGHS